MPKVNSKDGLTDKQRLALKAYLDPNSSTFLHKSKSIARYYNPKDINSASTIANQVITNENLQKITNYYPTLKIDPLLKQKLTKEWITTKILEIAESCKNPKDKAIALRAFELLGKLRDTQLFSEHSTQEITTHEVKSEQDLDQEFRDLIKPEDNNP